MGITGMLEALDVENLGCCLCGPTVRLLVHSAFPAFFYQFLCFFSPVPMFPIDPSVLELARLDCFLPGSLGMSITSTFFTSARGWPGRLHKVGVISQLHHQCHGI